MVVFKASLVRVCIYLFTYTFFFWIGENSSGAELHTTRGPPGGKVTSGIMASKFILEDSIQKSQLPEHMTKQLSSLEENQQSSILTSQVNSKSAK